MSTIALDHKDSDRTYVWSLVISLILHVLVIAPFAKGIIPKEFFQAEAHPVVVPDIEFELVSPPERPTPTSEKSRYLSTVSSAASDNVDAAEETPDLPHSEGMSPFPDNPSATNGEEGGGESDVPPLPEESVDLGQAFERSKFVQQSSPQRENTRPMEAPEFDNRGSTRASFGDISINTTAWDFAPYLLELKHRIKQHWIPPLAFTALGAIWGYTKINFRIYPDGSMEGLSVIESKGHESLHRSSENAIKGAAPFRPLPDDFPEEYLDITFGFYYIHPDHRDEILGGE